MDAELEDRFAEMVRERLSLRISTSREYIYVGEGATDVTELELVMQTPDGGEEVISSVTLDEDSDL